MEMPPAKLLKINILMHYQIVRDGFNRLRWIWRNDTPEKYQHSIKGYYRMIYGIDFEIGKIRKLLKKKDLTKIRLLF